MVQKALELAIKLVDVLPKETELFIRNWARATKAVVVSDRVIVFSEKPTKVSASVPIAVPRPRNSAEALMAVSEHVESLRNILCPQ